MSEPTSLAAAVAAARIPLTGALADDPVAGFVDDHLAELFRDLFAWLKIPSISADPRYAAAVRESAEWLAGALRRTGFPTVEIWETAGHPAVFAEWPSDDQQAPTATLYGHHDVQPVDPEELWQTPAFQPTVRGEELFARGAIDDKGQVAYHLLGLRAHLAATGRSSPAVNLKIIVEGEEEAGSEHFRELLAQRRQRLACDVVIVSDTSVYDRDTPSLCVGMRGLLYAEVTLHGPDGDLHSGTFGGGVPNPATVLTHLIAGLHDDAGRVTLPHFYDRVVAVAEAEREVLRRLPYDEAAWLATARSRAAAGEAGYTTLERVWTRPTAEVHGLLAGYTGPGAKTIIPTDATAKISFRLVADQRPRDVAGAFRRYVGQHTPPGVTAEVTIHGEGVRPCRTPLDTPALQAASRAMAHAFGQPVRYTREGGSGPEADLAEVLDCPVVFLGVGLPDDRIHAPNERAVLPMLTRGAVAAGRLWSELARPS